MATRWAPTSYKWCYFTPIKWPKINGYRWGKWTSLITGLRAHLANTTFKPMAYGCDAKDNYLFEPDRTLDTSAAHAPRISPLEMQFDSDARWLSLFPDAACREYWPTCPFECGHFSPFMWVNNLYMEHLGFIKLALRTEIFHLSCVKTYEHGGIFQATMLFC